MVSTCMQGRDVTPITHHIHQPTHMLVVVSDAAALCLVVRYVFANILADEGALGDEIGAAYAPSFDEFPLGFHAADHLKPVSGPALHQPVAALKAAAARERALVHGIDRVRRVKEAPLPIVRHHHRLIVVSLALLLDVRAQPRVAHRPAEQQPQALIHDALGHIPAHKQQQQPPHGSNMSADSGRVADGAAGEQRVWPYVKSMPDVSSSAPLKTGIGMGSPPLDKSTCKTFSPFSARDTTACLTLSDGSCC